MGGDRLWVLNERMQDVSKSAVTAQVRRELVLFQSYLIERDYSVIIMQKRHIFADCCRLLPLERKSPDRQRSAWSGRDRSPVEWGHYWPFVRGIRRSPVNSPTKASELGALMFSLICAWINRWVNNRKASDLRRHRAHYAVIVMGQRVGFSWVPVVAWSLFST